MSGSNTRSWRLQAPAATVLARVEIELAQTRSRVLNARLRSGAEQRELQVLDRSLAGRKLALPVLAQGWVEVELAFLGDPPAPAGARVKPRGQPYQAAQVESAATPPTGIDSAAAPAAVPVPGPELLEARRQAIHWNHQAQLFFAELEQRTNPRFCSDAMREQVREIDYKLGFRLKTRAFHDRNGRQPAFRPFAIGSSERGSLQAISRVFTELDEAYLENLQRFDWAFECFAIDQLYTGHPDPGLRRALRTQGVPNGIYYLKFAELACCCLDSYVDEEFWSARLQSLVRSTDAFLQHIVLPAGQPRRLSSAGYDYSPGRHTPAARLEALRRQYRVDAGGLTLNQVTSRFTRLIGGALQDQPGRVQARSGRPQVAMPPPL